MTDSSKALYIAVMMCGEDQFHYPLYKTNKTDD